MDKWDADWTPTGASWYDWLFGGLLAIITWPLVQVISLFRRNDGK